MEGRRLLQWVLSGIGIFIIVGYSYFVLDDFIRGPRIVLSSPENGFSTTTAVIVVSGRAIHTNNMTINDASVSVDLEGNFGSKLILAPGYNIIKITGKDSYARTIEKTIEITLVPKIFEQGNSSSTTAVLVGTSTVQVLQKISLPPKKTAPSACLPGHLFNITTGEKCTGVATSTGTGTLENNH